MEPLKRSDITGITLKMIGYYLEIVFVKGIPKTVSLSFGPKTLWRLGD